MKNEKIRIVGVIVLIVVLIFLITNSADLIKKSVDVFVVENGSLSFEESVEGYIIREETVYKGQNYKNGMVQIKSEGEKVSKGEKIFRYYSSGEEELNSQIADLDIKINQALEESGTGILNSDVLNLEKQIEGVLDNLYAVNDMSKQEEYLKRINAYITKKATIAGELSPAGSYVKDLINQRDDLKAQLNDNSEIMTTDESGIISYRVDGCEEVLGTNDFSYLNTKLLDDLNVKVASTIPQSEECGKVINNFMCYIACPMNSERAMEAKVGDSVSIKLSNSTKIPATIEYIVDEGQSRIVVFKIKQDVEKLIEYRKISFEIVWWDFSGWKISNQALHEENDLSYVYRNRATYQEKILVKVLRQNDIYSIVTNYTKEELENLGFSQEEIENMSEIKVYDEIVISK